MLEILRRPFPWAANPRSGLPKTRAEKAAAAQHCVVMDRGTQ